MSVTLSIEWAFNKEKIRKETLTLIVKGKNSKC